MGVVGMPPLYDFGSDGMPNCHHTYRLYVQQVFESYGLDMTSI